MGLGHSHSHGHDHGHDHGHSHGRSTDKKMLSIALILTAGFMIAEIRKMAYIGLNVVLLQKMHDYVVKRLTGESKVKIIIFLYIFSALFNLIKMSGGIKGDAYSLSRQALIKSNSKKRRTGTIATPLSTGNCRTSLLTSLFLSSWLQFLHFLSRCRRRYVFILNKP